MNVLYYPFLAYNGESQFLYPGVVGEDYREPKSVDRRDHVAGNYTLSYKVGKQDFIEVRFPWQSDALIIQWNLWWSTVMGGALFYYCTVDSVGLFGDGSLVGSQPFIGVGDTGLVNTSTLVKVDMLDFVPEREEVWGYWSVAIRMRKVVP